MKCPFLPFPHHFVVKGSRQSGVIIIIIKQEITGIKHIKFGLFGCINMLAKGVHLFILLLSFEYCFQFHAIWHQLDLVPHLSRSNRSHQ